MEITVDLVILLARVSVLTNYAKLSEEFHSNYLKVLLNSSNFSDGSKASADLLKETAP